MNSRPKQRKSKARYNPIPKGRKIYIPEKRLIDEVRKLPPMPDHIYPHKLFNESPLYSMLFR